MARAPAVAEIEVPPEADRLEGFPHPRETMQLYGHEEAERRFADLFGGGRMHHAWLITGPEGIGKATLAYRMARFLLARPEERDMFGASLDIGSETSAGRQVRALSHPGLLVVRRPYDPQKKRIRTEITVDEVRRLKTFLALTSDENAWRVVIVDPADDLNANAANALLKSLEEPPRRTVFLLVAQSPGSLLPTIRSRCRTLGLQPLRGDMLRKAVSQAIAASGEDVGAGAALEPGEWEQLETLSGGSVRRVLALKAAGGLALHTRLNAVLSALPRVDWTAIHALSDELASPAAEQRFELFYELLFAELARLLRVGAGGMAPPDEQKLAQKLVPEPNLASWAELWETLLAEKAQTLALNLDRKSLILETFVRLERAARL
jgi:DNA polymerase-3 subunit delta'